MSWSVLRRLQAVGTALTDSAQQSISGQKQSAKVEPGYVFYTRLPLLSHTYAYSCLRCCHRKDTGIREK